MHLRVDELYDRVPRLLFSLEVRDGAYPPTKVQTFSAALIMFSESDGPCASIEFCSSRRALSGSKGQLLDAALSR